MNETLEKILIQKASLDHIPLTANFELLPLCNMNCDMCYIRMSQQELLKNGSLLSYNDWIKIANELLENGTLFLLLTGGEPLLFPDFKKLYLSLHKLGFIITLNTNGTLIDEEWADFFAENKPRRINITLYGSSNETYEKLCHYSNGFSKTINGINLLKKRGIDVKINVSLVKENLSDLADIYDIGNKYHIPVFTDTYILPGRKEQNIPFQNQSRLDPKTAAAMELKIMETIMPHNIFYHSIENILSQIEMIPNQIYPSGLCCQAALCSCAVNWQGFLRPCVTLESPSINLLEYNFKDAWDILSEKVQYLKLNDFCSTCPLRIICPTCIGNCYAETKNPEEISSYICNYTKELYRLYKQTFKHFNSHK